MNNGEANYRRFLDGDDQGLVEIVREYNDTLTLFINGYVHNFSVAEELAEDVFFCLMVKKPSYSPKYSFKTWLFTIGRNRAINALRKKSKYLEFKNQAKNLQKAQQDLEEKYIKKQELIVLHRAIQELLPQYNEVLNLAYFEELSIAEIAGIMNKTVKQVNNLLYRAKSALKAKLEKEGFYYEGLS